MRVPITSLITVVVVLIATSARAGPIYSNLDPPQVFLPYVEGFDLQWSSESPFFVFGFREDGNIPRAVGTNPFDPGPVRTVDGAGYVFHYVLPALPAGQCANVQLDAGTQRVLDLAMAAVVFTTPSCELPPCTVNCGPPPGCTDCVPTTVPEPATLVLFGLGLSGIAARLRPAIKARARTARH